MTRIDKFYHFSLSNKYNIKNIKTHFVIDTFASELLQFEEKNEPFCLENTSKLTHEFLYDIFNKKILINFLV